MYIERFDLPIIHDDDGIHGWWYDGKLAEAVASDPWNTAEYINIHDGTDEKDERIWML